MFTFYLNIRQHMFSKLQKHSNGTSKNWIDMSCTILYFPNQLQ